MYRSTLWMPDGNIILSAKQPDTDSAMFFKVHKSVLARHSTFFADLFSLPSEPVLAGVEDTYQGIPIVPMYDSAEDVEALLKAVYNPTTHLLPKEQYEHGTPLDDRRLYTLTDKYGFETFATRIKDHTAPARRRSSSV